MVLLGLSSMSAHNHKHKHKHKHNHDFEHQHEHNDDHIRRMLPPVVLNIPWRLGFRV